MSLLRRILDADDPRCSHDSRYCSPPPPRLLPPFPTLYAPAPPPSAVNTPADVLSLPPPPPPSTRIQISNKNHFLILVAVVVAGTVLAVCLLSLAYYAARRYRSSRRRRRTAAVLGPPPPPSDDLLQEDLLEGAAGGGVEEPYHVWYIRTVGLDQAVIGAITVCEYKKGAGIVEGTDCAVCLGEFAEGEALRLLPKCSHAFHVPCIDTWLRSHVNCPLCRAPVLAPAPARPPPPLPSPNSAPSEMAAAAVQSSENSGGSEEDGDAAFSPLAQAVVDGAAAGSVGSSSSVEGLEIWVPIDLGDEVPSCVAGEERHVDGERQPVRRSVSMDSSALAGVLLRTRMAGSSRDGWRKPSVGGDGSANRKRRIGEDGYSRKGILLIDDPSGVERSMSGGRFFLSRLSGRTRGSNTILPL